LRTTAAEFSLVLVIYTQTLFHIEQNYWQIR
jgi:hypothetical protein